MARRRNAVQWMINKRVLPPSAINFLKTYYKDGHALGSHMTIHLCTGTEPAQKGQIDTLTVFHYHVWQYYLHSAQM